MPLAVSATRPASVLTVVARRDRLAVDRDDLRAVLAAAPRRCSSTRISAERQALIATASSLAKPSPGVDLGIVDVLADVDAPRTCTVASSRRAVAAFERIGERRCRPTNGPGACRNAAPVSSR